MIDDRLVSRRRHRKDLGPYERTGPEVRMPGGQNPRLQF